MGSFLRHRGRGVPGDPPIQSLAMREVQPMARVGGGCHRQMDQEGRHRPHRIRHGLLHSAGHRRSPLGDMQHRQSQEERWSLAQDPPRHNSLPGVRKIGAHPLQGGKAQSGDSDSHHHMLPQGLQLQDRREGHQGRKELSRDHQGYPSEWLARLRLGRRNGSSTIPYFGQVHPVENARRAQNPHDEPPFAYEKHMRLRNQLGRIGHGDG